MIVVAGKGLMATALLLATASRLKTDRRSVRSQERWKPNLNFEFIVPMPWPFLCSKTLEAKHAAVALSRRATGLSGSAAAFTIKFRLRHGWHAGGDSLTRLCRKLELEKQCTVGYIKGVLVVSVDHFNNHLHMLY